MTMNNLITLKNITSFENLVRLLLLFVSLYIFVELFSAMTEISKATIFFSLTGLVYVLSFFFIVSTLLSPTVERLQENNAEMQETLENHEQMISKYQEYAEKANAKIGELKANEQSYLSKLEQASKDQMQNDNVLLQKIATLEEAQTRYVQSLNDEKQKVSEYEQRLDVALATASKYDKLESKVKQMTFMRMKITDLAKDYPLLFEQNFSKSKEVENKEALEQYTSFVRTLSAMK
jgi:ABC-type multidrug transport system fused ATPase/permease subunit